MSSSTSQIACTRWRVFCFLFLSVFLLVQFDATLRTVLRNDFFCHKPTCPVVPHHTITSGKKRRGMCIWWCQWFAEQCHSYSITTWHFESAFFYVLLLCKFRDELCEFFYCINIELSIKESLCMHGRGRIICRLFDALSLHWFSNTTT